MRWILVDKSNTQQPTSGTYSSWKGILAAEGQHQCVYCAIHESQFGGVRNFHVEHYRPRSRFADLINDIANLFLACSVCNVLKSDDWPGEPAVDFSNASYPSPAQVDYNDLFETDGKGEIRGLFPASRYLIASLALNRTQLILERRLVTLIEQLSDCKTWAEYAFHALQAYDDAEAKDLARRLFDFQNLFINGLISLRNTVPYEYGDTHKR